MIELKSSSDATWITQTSRVQHMSESPRAIHDRQTVGGKRAHDSLLILRKDADVDRNLVVKQTDAAPNHGALIGKRQKRKAQSRREIVVLADAVTIPTQAKINCEPGVCMPRL